MALSSSCFLCSSCLCFLGVSRSCITVWGCVVVGNIVHVDVKTVVVTVVVSASQGTQGIRTQEPQIGHSRRRGTIMRRRY